MPKREGQVGHRERPAWETQIAKLDGKAELVVNPAMLADKIEDHRRSECTIEYIH
jgi:hypothetical protein